MGWVDDCADLLLALGKWGKRRYQSNEWKKKLESVTEDLWREDADVRVAEETVKLAKQAGYSGPELTTVEERIDAIREYERKRKPPRTVATKMRKKKAATKKPAVKKKAAGRKSTAKKKRPIHSRRRKPAT